MLDNLGEEGFSGTELGTRSWPLGCVSQYFISRTLSTGSGSVRIFILKEPELSLFVESFENKAGNFVKIRNYRKFQVSSFKLQFNLPETVSSPPLSHQDHPPFVQAIC